MDSEDIEEASLTKISEVQVWVQLLIEHGEIVEIVHSTQYNDFENFAEVIVVIDDNEYIWPFIELSMMVLVAHTQRTIDDIVEAYLFKELHDLAY